MRIACLFAIQRIALATIRHATATGSRNLIGVRESLSSLGLGLDSMARRQDCPARTCA